MLKTWYIIKHLLYFWRNVSSLVKLSKSPEIVILNLHKMRALFFKGFCQTLLTHEA